MGRYEKSFKNSCLGSLAFIGLDACTLMCTHLPLEHSPVCRWERPWPRLGLLAVWTARCTRTHRQHHRHRCGLCLEACLLETAAPASSRRLGLVGGCHGGSPPAQCIEGATRSPARRLTETERLAGSCQTPPIAYNQPHKDTKVT